MWTEKYRPRTLKGVIGQDIVVEKIEKLLEKPNDFPHLLFHSRQAGTGKTSIALIVARTLLETKRVPNADCRIFNASKMSIDVLRDELDAFARHQTGMFSDHKFKKRIAILEEIDYLRKDNQGFLRRQIEELEGNCIFIATCNDIDKVSKPIISRFGGGIRFSAITKDAMKKKLSRIAKKEKLKVDDTLLEKIYTDSDGDMRLSVHLLQNHGGVDIQSIEDDKADLWKLVSSAMKGDRSQMEVLRKVQKEGDGIHVNAIRNMAYSVAMTQKKYNLLPYLDEVDIDGGDVASANLLWNLISVK
tara:strand:- start:17209 stop:18114 length:906 start_codon:yes stop_codon:yes gene_type:complete